MPAEEPLFADLSDLRGSDVPEARDLESELFNRRPIKEMVASIEKELGLNPGKKQKKNIKRHAEVLAPSREEDGAKLHKILNEDEKYRVAMWKDTWTVHGDYRVFVIYEEFIDDKKKDR